MNGTTLIESKTKGQPWCFKNSAVTLAEIITGKADAGGDGSPAPIVMFVSSETVDADGDVIHQRANKKGPGWVLKRFNGAPLISWQHDLRVPNLSGPETRAKLGKHEAKGQGLFLDPLAFDMGDGFAVTLEGKVRRDVIKESSVGFKILARDPRKVDGQTVGLDIWGAELWEVALANRGANPDTEVLAKHLLALPEVSGDVEDGGSPEVLELRAEIVDLAGKVDLLTKALKALTDKSDEDAARILTERKAQEQAAQAKAANELLAAIKSVGVVRSS